MAFTEQEEQELRAVLKIYKSQAPSISDDLAADAYGLFDEWDGAGHAYSDGERVQYDGALYTCLQAHTSQADWAPTAAPSLWASVLDAAGADAPAGSGEIGTGAVDSGEGAGGEDTGTGTEGGTSTVPEWVQPSSTNGYAQGDQVMHNGKLWQSIVANNVWEPGVTGTETVWLEVTVA